VSLAKQRSGFRYKQAHGARLWQESYFDRVLRSDEPEMTVVRYIVSNPIRTGIVETAQEYPFWGSQVHTREEILDAISRL
jgi:REP element-mobilizing transposase RayT